MNNTKVQALQEKIERLRKKIILKEGNDYSVAEIIKLSHQSGMEIGNAKGKLSQAQEDKIEFDKLISKFEKLRLYRSKSCQLLLRRLKEELQ